MSVLEHPAPGTYSLAGFGPRAPIKTSAGYSDKFHRGRDYSLHGRSFKVLAAREGVVRWAYHSPNGGNEVLIEHKVPGFPYFATRYSHLRSIDPRIRAGVRVSGRQYLGPAGESGRADGIHLHFEVLTAPPDGVRFTQTDPDPFLPGADKASAAVPEKGPLMALTDPEQAELLAAVRAIRDDQLYADKKFSRAQRTQDLVQEVRDALLKPRTDTGGFPLLDFLRSHLQAVYDRLPRTR